MIKIRTYIVNIAMGATRFGRIPRRRHHAFGALTGVGSPPLAGKEPRSSGEISSYLGARTPAGSVGLMLGPFPGQPL
jgi:hypothetical protein